MSSGARQDLFAIPVRRPVATAMFFLGVVLLGLIAWQRIPVNLLPDVAGEQLFVTFARPGSEPEVIEREILLPLESRASLLEGLDETRATIRGSGGSLTLEFRPGTDLAVRELEMRRLAADLVREQPAGTTINVDNSDFSQMVGFAMFIQVTGMDDLNSLMDLVDDQVVPRMAGIDGVARVSAGGGAPQELTVEIDSDRCAALGIEPGQVVSSLSRTVQRLDYLGGIEDRDRRTAVVLDGRPRGIDTLSRSRVVAERPVELRHVAEIEFGTSELQTLLRVNGEPTVGLVVFQDEDANLIRLGRALRSRLDELREEFAPYNLDFVINFDAAKDLIEKQLDRLKELALTGFVIALVVLFLFLRQWRAVAVVAVAVPTSLLAALALLYVAGLSLNLLTLFGLGVVIGSLVDNSIVVYEAVQRRLEHGADADDAAADGIRRTVRAILAASATNAVVFLPLMFADFAAAELRAYLEIMALAILLPMVGSVLVAVGLVPLLARRLAAPAALARVKRVREERKRTGGLKPPDRAGELFIGTLIVALRRPGIWVTGVVTAILITVVFVLPTVAVTSLNQDPPEEDTVRLAVTLDSADSLDRAAELFTHLEQEVMKLEGIEGVDSTIQEENGQLTVRLPDAEDRPDELNAAAVRAAARRVEKQSRGAVELDTVQDGFGGGGGLAALTDTGSTEILISGPETRGLLALAGELADRLESISEIDTARVSSRSAQDELRVVANDMAMNAFRLTPDQVLPALNTVRREGVAMQVGFTLPDGREIPLTVRRQAPPRRAIQDLERLRLNTSSGVLPLEAVADVRRMPPPPTITHENGRRQVKVNYTLGREAPATGNARLALDKRITDAVGDIYRPAGYTIEVPDEEKSYSWFRSLLVPVLLLLFAVLAITFESMTMPVLVLLSLPLTVLGATWALLLGNVPGLDPMALMGVLALIGLTVNPAILLVDRMQARVRLSGFTAGAAALAAVRERSRPVLMTTATTVAGLWPLALSTGQANELWPPFATVVMGGLVTSTLLTLLVIPVGFVFLHRLDGIFGRLGPWVVIGWAAAVSLTMVPLIRYEIIQSTTWQIMTTLLVGSLFLGLAALILRRVPQIEPAMAGGAPPTLEVRYLNKVYGRPGPIGRAWRVQERFSNAVLARGGQPFAPPVARERLLPLLLLFLGAGYLAFSVGAVGWRLIFVFVASALAAGFCRQIRCARGLADERGRVLPGGVENLLAVACPWVALSLVVLLWTRLGAFAQGLLEGAGQNDLRLWVPAVIGVIIVVAQLGRRTAKRLALGTITESVTDESFAGMRRSWRRLSRRVFGLDLPREEVHAVRGVHFTAERGMIGVLGPNGAGKTTLLRTIAGILDPTVGAVRIGDVPLEQLRKRLARYQGYLPQDFGLPGDLTAREYLEYYALLYEIKPAAHRAERVDRLLKEVGLGEKADSKIGSYSGGMRQRVAVARTLLRLPPIIIVDEPTVGLDPRERIRFRNLLSRLAEGRIVLFSTHVVEDVAVACERVVVMTRGKMVFDGIPDDLQDEAVGKVWEITLDELVRPEVPEGAMVVDEVPVGDGRVRTRVLHDAQPHPEAVAVDPVLEDGYLWLAGGGGPR